MAITHSTQDITTTASVLGAPITRRMTLIIRNPAASGASIYVGGSGVTTANASFVIAAGDPSLVLASGDRDLLGIHQWYARTASGTASGVAITEID